MSRLSATSHPVISRRKFLAQAGVASSAAVVLAPESAHAGSSNPVRRKSVDVLVIGGGTAGTIAAIQAARLGASTVLVEQAGQLGGTTTTAGVDFPGLFHAWGKQVIAGIAWDLVTETAALNGDPLPDFTVPTGSHHSRHQVRISGPLYAALAEEACLKAGVQLRYYEFPLSAERAQRGWKVVLAGKGTRMELAARQLVDCTGNAAVIGMLGLPRQRGEVTQPGTLIYRLGGFQLDGTDSETLKTLEQKARAAVHEGTLRETDFNHRLQKFLAARGENAMHVPGADSSTSEAHTATNISGRASLLRMMRFLKQQPGFEKVRIERLQAETGVRETFRITGETIITHEDYTTGRKFPDAIAYSFYPIDLHDEKGVRPKHLAEGVVPTVPLGALIPKGSQNILAAGRCVSSDRLANSALRVQASCMAMGQAAGAAAALAARTATSPSRVPIHSVRDALRANGAIVPEV